jgi:sugar/nucleoside kinase (ribokinase family)
MNPPAVVGLGALNADRILLVDRLLADGESIVKDAGTFAGGSAANTVYGLAKLGVASGFVGAVGSDAEGRSLLRDFKKANVDTSHVAVKKGARTGTVLCLSSNNNRALYVLAGANAMLTADDIDMDYISGAEYLHLSSFVDDAQFELSRSHLRKLPPTVKLSFSPGALYVARGIEALRPFLRCADALFINRDEIEKLTGDDFRPGCTTAINTGSKSVVVTLGSGFKQGGTQVVAYVCDGKNEWYIDAGQGSKVDVVDTTGAGDAFAAGYLFGTIEGKDPLTCGRLGNCMAQLSLVCSGARQGLPTRHQLTAYFNKLYPES